jgi:hypothetical protein
MLIEQWPSGMGISSRRSEFRIMHKAPVPRWSRTTPSKPSASRCRPLGLGERVPSWLGPRLLYLGSDSASRAGPRRVRGCSSARGPLRQRPAPRRLCGHGFPVASLGRRRLASCQFRSCPGQTGLVSPRCGTHSFRTDGKALSRGRKEEKEKNKNKKDEERPELSLSFPLGNLFRQTEQVGAAFTNPKCRGCASNSAEGWQCA